MSETIEEICKNCVHFEHDVKLWNNIHVGICKAIDSSKVPDCFYRYEEHCLCDCGKFEKVRDV